MLDALPVLVEEPTRLAAPRSGRGLARERGPIASIPAVGAAAMAAGGFVAGAAVVGLVHRRQRNSAALAQGGRVARALSRRGARKGSPGAELLQIVGSRTLLVDVHLLGTPDADR